MTATDRASELHSTLALPSAHRHVCLACSRLHPEEAVSSPERRRHNLPRLNSAPPMTSHAPRIDSLSNMARERDRERRMQQFLAARKREQRPIGNSRKSHRESSRAGRADAPTDTPDLELSTVDLRRRRHSTAIAPTSRSCDLSSRSKGLTARDLLRANATELRPSRHVPTSYSCDFTGSTPKMAIRNAKDLELSTADLRGAPTSYSCDFTGQTPSPTPLDEQSGKTNELELSTVDLRLPKYQAKLPPKKGRRKDSTARSALTPISIEHLAAIDAKLSSVEHQLERYNVDNNIQRANQSERHHTKGRAKRASTADSIDFTESKVVTIEQEQMLTSNRSRVVEKKSVKPWGYGRSAKGSDRTSKTPTEPVDFHLSSLNLRQRRHTTTDVSPLQRDPSLRCNRDTVEKENERLIPLQRKHKTEPIDFHLSTFDLTPKSNSSGASPKADRSEDGDRQTRTAKKESSPTTEVETPTYSKYATRDPCDLSYLDNFRSYTV